MISVLHSQHRTFDIPRLLVSWWIQVLMAKSNGSPLTGLYFMGKSMVPCRFSLKSTHWIMEHPNLIWMTREWAPMPQESSKKSPEKIDFKGPLQQLLPARNLMTSGVRTAIIHIIHINRMYRLFVALSAYWRDFCLRFPVPFAKKEHTEHIPYPLEICCIANWKMTQYSKLSHSTWRIFL